MNRNTTPITDLENVMFVHFGGCLDKGERQIESTEDVLLDHIAVRENMDIDKERKYYCRPI
jgi:hypothetical protein